MEASHQDGHSLQDAVLARTLRKLLQAVNASDACQMGCIIQVTCDAARRYFGRNEDGIGNVAKEAVAVAGEWVLAHLTNGPLETGAAVNPVSGVVNGQDENVTLESRRTS